MPSPPPRIKIAVVIPKYGLTGGAEHFAASLSEALAQNPAYDLHVLANRWRVRSQTVTFHRLPLLTLPRFLTTASFAWFANRALAQGRYDIIHSHERIFQADLFTMHGVPHRFWTREIRGKGLSLHDRVTAWVEGKLARDPACQYLLPVSTLARDQYQREFPEAEGRLRVMHPGIDTERFSPAQRPVWRQELRGRFGIGSADFVLLFVGMNFELKGLGQLIAALGQARAQRPQTAITLLVAGKGDTAGFRKLAARHGVQDSVRFAGVQHDMEKLYAAADAHALLSGFDTFGMTVLEAMASGLPVLITATVGARDLVADGVQGYIVDREDSAQVSDRIVALLDDATRQAMGRAARQVAEEHSWAKLSQEISHIYDAILARKYGRV